MSDEETVRAKYPNAELYGHHHGKVRVQSGGLILSEMKYLGTSSKRHSDAWKDAAERIARGEGPL